MTFIFSAALHLLGSEFLKVIAVVISLPVTIFRVKTECLCYAYSSVQTASEASTSFAALMSQKYAQNVHTISLCFDSAAYCHSVHVCLRCTWRVQCTDHEKPACLSVRMFHR